MSERDNLLFLFSEDDREIRRCLWEMADRMHHCLRSDLEGQCHTRPLIWITTSLFHTAGVDRAYIVQADVRFKSSRLAVDHANPQINNPYCRSAQINRQRFHLSAD